jgi:uncharacterized protein
MDKKAIAKEFIIKGILDHRRQLEIFGVKSIGLFGSFVRGEQTDLSDIDILAEFAAEKHTFDNYMDVVFLLETVFKRTVHLITPEALSPHIGPYILKEIERVTIAA